MISVISGDKLANSFENTIVIDYPEGNSSVVDMIRLILQLNQTQPVFEIIPETLKFEGTPLHNFKVPFIVQHIPVPSQSNKVQWNTKRVEAEVNIINTNYPLMCVTTDDLKFQVDSTTISNPFKGNPYIIQRLRKGEGMQFKAVLKWVKSIYGQGATVIRPVVDHDFVKKQYKITIKSRGFYTIHQILKNVCLVIQEQIDRYRNILATPLKDHTEENKEKERYEVNGDGTLFDISLDNEVDYHLAIKNALSSIINDSDDMAFNFTHFKNNVQLVATDYKKVGKVFDQISKFWSDFEKELEEY